MKLAAVPNALWHPPQPCLPREGGQRAPRLSLTHTQVWALCRVSRTQVLLDPATLLPCPGARVAECPSALYPASLVSSSQPQPSCRGVGLQRALLC